MVHIDNATARRSGLAIAVIVVTIGFLILRVIWAAFDPPEWPLPVGIGFGLFVVGVGSARCVDRT